MKHIQFSGLSSGGALFIHTVGLGNRLRLPPEAGDFAPWLKGDSRKAIMSLSAHGGVQLSRAPVSVQKELQQVFSLLEKSPPKAQEAGSEWMRLMRYQLTQCEVEFSEDRFGIVLPREFREMGILPSKDGVAAVLFLGDILEIWRADKWVEHVRNVHEKLSEVTERALNELESR